MEREVYIEYVAKATGLEKRVVKSEVAALLGKKTKGDVVVSHGVEALDANVLAARFVLRQCLLGLEKWDNYADLMPTDSLRKAADYINECVLTGTPIDVGTLYHVIEQEEADKIINFDVKKYESMESAAFRDCLALLRKEYMRSKIAELNERYRLSTSDAERSEIMQAIAEEEAKYRRSYGKQ